MVDLIGRGSRAAAGGRGNAALRFARREPSRAEVARWRRVDWVLVAATVVLCILGALLVWAATKSALTDQGSDPQYFLKRDVLNIIIGAVLGTIVAALDYQRLRAWIPLIYIASCLGLLAVLAVGSTVNGAHSWIVLPAGFELQPSEFAKLGLVVSIALLLAERRLQTLRRSVWDVPLVLMLVGVPAALIMAQPDIGTVFVLIFIVFSVFIVAGVAWRWILALVAAGGVLGYLAIALHVLKPYQLARFTAFAHPNANTLAAAYNVRQSKIAIGSGGWTGTGLFHGPQTNGGFVPEQHTDFIFSVAGEEWGLIGAGVVVLLFGVVLWRGVRIAATSPDLFGRLVGAGIVAWLAFQGFVNIGMTMGLMPVTGLPLPFVSYGGSAMFANATAIGLLVNVHMRNQALPRAVGAAP